MPIEDDLRASLRRAAASADPPGSAWDQLVDRAERPVGTSATARGRIGAGLVAAVVTIAAFAFVVRAFAPAGPDDVRDPTPLRPDVLESTVWILEEVGEASMADAPALDLTFTDGEFAARSECNRIGGRYEIEGTTLATSGGVQTQAGCQGAAADRQQVIFGVLGSSPAIQLTGATLTLTSDAGVLRYVTDPCSLLSDGDVEGATGDRVTASGVVPPERMRVPGSPRLCLYEAPGTYASVVVHIVPATLQEFHALRDRNPESNITIPVDGIGDEAFIQGMNSITVFRGDHYVGIGLQHGAGTPGVERVLEDLALAALGQDGPIDEPADDTGSLSELGNGWTELAEPPEVRSWNAAKVWTGEGLLVWGGYEYTGFSDEVALDDGFLWDPITGASRTLAPAPLAARVHHAFAWTGRELLVWGGSSEKGFDGRFADGAVYSPDDDTWRSMSPAPLTARVPSFSVWTGTEFVVWGDQGDPDVIDGAAYDPATDTWRSIAQAPAPGRWREAVWTGAEVVVFTESRSFEQVWAAVYDPFADTWRADRLPLGVVSTAAWDGQGVVAWSLQHDLARYDPSTGTWTTLPDAPLDESNYYPEAVGVPGFVFGVQAGEAVVLDVAQDRWLVVTQKELLLWDTHQIVAAGDVVITLRREPGTGERLAFAYRPAG